MWIETIAAWGDSVTYGAGDSESLGWAGRLRRRVEADHATELYNLGLSGETSTGLLSRFETELKSFGPDLILIAIGTNDSVFRDNEDNRETPVEDYKANLDTLFTKAKGKTSHVFTVGLMSVTDALVRPIPWSETRKSYKTSILKEYDDALRDRAAAHGVTCIDMWDAITPADLADGLHPNAAGYEKMYLKIHEAIKPFLVS